MGQHLHGTTAFKRDAFNMIFNKSVTTKSGSTVRGNGSTKTSDGMKLSKIISTTLYCILTNTPRLSTRVLYFTSNPLLIKLFSAHTG